MGQLVKLRPVGNRQQDTIMPHKVSGLVQVLREGNPVLTWRNAAALDRMPSWSAGLMRCGQVGVESKRCRRSSREDLCGAAFHFVLPH
jgi:hypothetical protein